MVKVSVAGKTLADFPDLVKQIDRKKQPDLNPKNMTAGSHKRVWWRCPEGPDHEWSTKLQARTSQGYNCPFCPPSPKKVSVTNSLQTKYPEISKEWHPTKNGDLKPKDIISGSHVLFWWKCDKGPDHEWRANPGNRTGRKSNCPCCAGKKVSVTNSLASLFPDIESVNCGRGVGYEINEFVPPKHIGTISATEIRKIRDK